MWGNLTDLAPWVGPMKTKKHTIGEDLLEMEGILDRFVDKHGLQKGDILALISSHIDIHRPDCIEVYVDGTSPVLFYGPKE